MSKERVFPGVGKTGKVRQIKFGIYSFLLAVIIKSFFHLVGALGNKIIINGNTLEKGTLVLYFVLFYVVAYLWCVFFIGIRKEAWIKMIAVAFFPSLVMILLRASHVYDAYMLISVLAVIMVITPMMVTFVYFGSYGFIQSEGKKQRREFYRFFFQFAQPLCLPALTMIVVYVLIISSNYRSITDYEENYGRLITYSDQEKRDILKDYLEKNYGNVRYADKSGFIPANEGDLWSANIEGLKQLRRDIYDSLTIVEKLNALQLLTDIEIYDLTGETDFVELVSADLKTETIGSYYSKTRTIVLTTSILEDRDKAIESLLHECKHAHQHYLTDYLNEMNMLDNQAVKRSSYGKWQEEFEDYNKGEESGFADYYNQDVEEDSRAYAYIWARHYRMYIDRITDNTVDVTNLEIK